MVFQVKGKYEVGEEVFHLFFANDILILYDACKYILEFCVQFSCGLMQVQPKD